MTPLGDAHMTLQDQEMQSEGPFTEFNNKPHGQFATFPVVGNTVLLEYYAPYNVDEMPMLRISHLVHGYKDISPVHPHIKGSSGPCNINVNCKEGADWANEIRSVVMMLTRYGQGFCSGAMINNALQDGRQLFLTAYHCVERGDNSKDMLLFNHQHKTCDSRSPPMSPERQTAQGLKALARLAASDFALFELEEEVPESYGVRLAGWSAEPQPPATPVGIHHPSADMKKITFSALNATEACWGGRCGRRVADHWRIEQWHKGTTEPGSSGSPLFDATTGRIVGQLHGGSASCYNRNGYDVYGKVWYSFDKGSDGERLKDFLDPEDSGVLVMDGVDLNDARELRFQVQA